MDSLSNYFGDGRVFRDIEGIEGGANFEEVLSETVGSADAVIVLIGPDWLNMTEIAGNGVWTTLMIGYRMKSRLPCYRNCRCFQC